MLSHGIPTQHNAYIGLGSNLGDRAGNLLLGDSRNARRRTAVSRLSQIYETEPVETFAQPRFLNMVAELRGDPASPEEVMARLLRVEHSLGRTRDTAKGSAHNRSRSAALSATRPATLSF